MGVVGFETFPHSVQASRLEGQRGESQSGKRREDIDDSNTLTVSSKIFPVVMNESAWSYVGGTAGFRVGGASRFRRPTLTMTS